MILYFSGTGNSKYVAGNPVWQNKNCTGCLRCYHNCPKRAIEWGKFTRNKGQKVSPKI